MRYRGRAARQERGLPGAAGEDEVEDAGHHQPDDPGNIHAAQVRDHRTGVELGRDEGHLHQHARHVDQDAGPVPAAVAAIGVRQRGRVVAFAVDEVVVDQVDGAPGREEGQQEQDERLEGVQERMLPRQRHTGGRAHDQQHEHQPLAPRDVHMAAKAADDGGDAHEAAIRIQRRDGDLAERDAEVQQRRRGARAAQADDVGHLAAGELSGRHGRSQHAQGHGDLRAQHRARADRQEGPERRRAAGQVARIVGHVGAVGDLPGGRQRYRQQERGPAEMADPQQLAEVAQRDHAAEQVNEGDQPQHAGHAADDVDHAVAEHGHQHDDGGEQQDARAVADPEQLADGLARQHRARGGEAQVHQAHQYDGNRRAVDAELHPAGDHLRQAQPGPLRRVQGHHGAAEHLADEQADQRPEHIAAQHHRQRARDNGGDLQVGAEPERELAVEPAVALALRDVVDGASFDQRHFLRRAVLLHARSPRGHRPAAPWLFHSVPPAQRVALIMGRSRPCSRAQSMAMS